MINVLLCVSAQDFTSSFSKIWQEIKFRLRSPLHGCWAIEATIATVSKVEICKAEEVYVVRFVPSHMLAKKRPISLDPFLEPLTDIQTGSIKLNYNLATCGKPAQKTTIKHLIPCTTTIPISQDRTAFQKKTECPWQLGLIIIIKWYYLRGK